MFIKERYEQIMRQDEFINCFREALIGKVPEQIIQDNVNYYKDYISSQIRSGKSESEVLRSLGDPRLLAKTIEESNKFAGNSAGNGYYSNNSGNGYYSNDYDYNYKKTNNGYEPQSDNKSERMLQFKGWFVFAVVILLLIIVAMLVFRVAVVLAPVALLIVAGSIIVKGIKQWMRS